MTGHHKASAAKAKHDADMKAECEAMMAQKQGMRLGAGTYGQRERGSGKDARNENLEMVCFHCHASLSGGPWSARSGALGLSGADGGEAPPPTSRTRTVPSNVFKRSPIRRLPASAVPVIAAASEQKDQHDDQEDEVHDLFPPFS
jgi:hypothetical protein